MTFLCHCVALKPLKAFPHYYVWCMLSKGHSVSRRPLLMRETSLLPLWARVSGLAQLRCKLCWISCWTSHPRSCLSGKYSFIAFECRNQCCLLLVSFTVISEVYEVGEIPSHCLFLSFKPRLWTSYKRTRTSKPFWNWRNPSHDWWVTQSTPLCSC